MIKQDNPYDDLKKIFHEPKRLAIMSALCASSSGGMTFTELKLACEASDGNLNRHLKVLQDAGAVKLSKKFVRLKPCTTIRLSEKGVDQFNDYLRALELVLREAMSALPAARAKDAAIPHGGGVAAVRLRGGAS